MRIYFRYREQLAIAGLLMAALVVLIGRYTMLNWEQPAVNMDRPLLRSAEFTIDINKAGWTELALMPGIGETLAKRIVGFRRQHGRYESIEDLLKVSGIGPNKLKSMRRFLRRPSIIQPASV